MRCHSGGHASSINRPKKGSQWRDSKYLYTPSQNDPVLLRSRRMYLRLCHVALFDDTGLHTQFLHKLHSGTLLWRYCFALIGKAASLSTLFVAIKEQRAATQCTEWGPSAPYAVGSRRFRWRLRPDTEGLKKGLVEMSHRFTYMHAHAQKQALAFSPQMRSAAKIQGHP